MPNVHPTARAAKQLSGCSVSPGPDGLSVMAETPAPGVSSRAEVGGVLLMDHIPGGETEATTSSPMGDRDHTKPGSGAGVASVLPASLQLLQAHPDWRRSWSHIVPGDF